MMLTQELSRKLLCRALGSSQEYTFYFDHRLSLFNQVEAKLVPFYTQQQRKQRNFPMNTSGETSTGWIQFFEQTVDQVSDATIVTTSTVSSESLHSPNASSSKPVTRRPRVSKKKPITLLNANTSNFRALVQRFTGCPATTLSTNRRVPVNLSFALGAEHNQTGTAASMMPTAGNHFYYRQSHQQQQQHQSFGIVDPSSSSRGNADQILDEFDLDNITLQAFNRGNANDGNYFL